MLFYYLYCTILIYIYPILFSRNVKNILVKTESELNGQSLCRKGKIKGKTTHEDILRERREKDVFLGVGVS
jgi:hypothetical protein